MSEIFLKWATSSICSGWPTSHPFSHLWVVLKLQWMEPGHFDKCDSPHMFLFLCLRDFSSPLQAWSARKQGSPKVSSLREGWELKETLCKYTLPCPVLSGAMLKYILYGSLEGSQWVKLQQPILVTLSINTCYFAFPLLSQFPPFSPFCS